MLGGQALLDLVLEAHAFFEPAHGGDRTEQPGQLSRLGHVGLDEQCRLPRIEPQGKQIGQNVEDMLTHPAGVAHAGQRMIIGDEVVGFVTLLKRDVLANRTEVVADVQGA